VFTARYALSPYIKQTRFVFKGLIRVVNSVEIIVVNAQADQSFRGSSADTYNYSHQGHDEES
jgi:hypothetical protein